MDMVIFELLIVILVFLILYGIMEFKFKHFIPETYSSLFTIVMFLIIFGKIYFEVADSSAVLIFILFAIVGIYPFLKKNKTYYTHGMNKKVIKEKNNEILALIEDFKNNNLDVNSDISFTGYKLIFTNVGKPKIKECLTIIENYLTANRKNYTFNDYFIYYMKSLIFPIVIALVVAFSIIKLTDYSSKIEVSNLINIQNELIIGNTEGNINNYGLVAETDDSIYYVKDFILYKSDKDLKNETVIVDKPQNIGKDTINVVEDWIFFRQGKEIKRVKTDGTKLETIFKGYSSEVHVVGNWVYFISIEDENKIIRIDVNGRDKQILSEKNVDDMAIYKGKIYYSYKNRDGSYLKVMNLDGTDSQIVSNVKTRSMTVDENYIYYIDDAEEIMYRTDIKNKTKEKLSDEKILKFIKYDNSITYTLKNPDNSSWRYIGLYIMGADGSDMVALDSENYLAEMGMGVTKDYVFYSSTNGKEQPSFKNIQKSDYIKSLGEDKLKLQMENENFIFYSFDKDKECIEELAKVLDENYNTILKNLNVKLENKVKIEIYPNIKGFHGKIGMPNAPDWLVGVAQGNKIYMVSPLNPGNQHTYSSLMKVIVHEFTHVVEFNINPSVNKIRWLCEGLATYEAKQVTYSQFIKSAIDSNAIPTLSELNSIKFEEIGGYSFSYTIIEYLVNEYGYETIVSIIKSPENIEEILGKSIIEFEIDWKNFLRENYGSKTT